jgi:hypothetical protein
MNALDRLKAANAAKESSVPVQMDATKAVEQVAQTLPITSTAAEHRLAALARLKGGPVNPPEWQPPPVNAEERDQPPVPVSACVQVNEPVKRHRRTKAEMEAARASTGIMGSTSDVVQVPATLSVGDVSNEPVTLIVKDKDTIPAPAPVPENAPIRAQVTTTVSIPTTVELVTDMPIPYLFVDCVPQGLEVENLANVIAIASGLICKAQKVGDYRYIEFGKGTAMLVESMVHIVKTNPGRNYMLDSGTPEGHALLNPISALSAIIVRGVR